MWRDSSHYTVNRDARRPAISKSVCGVGRSIVALVLLWAGSGGIGGSLTAQERFIMSQEDSVKYRLAKQYYQKGGQLLSKNKPEAAEKEFKSCVETFPIYSHAWYALGQIAYAGGDFNQAMTYVLKAKETFPEISKLDSGAEMQYLEMARNERANTQEQLFQTKEMLSRLALDTKLSEVERNRLQNQYQNQIMKLENHVRDLDNRLNKPIPEKNEVPADFFYLHGNILFKMKKYMDSMREYFEAVRVDPAHGGAYNNLANLHYMARKYEKALYYIDKAIANDFKVDPRFREAVLKAIASQQ